MSILIDKNTFFFPLNCPICKQLVWLAQQKEQLLIYEAGWQGVDYHLCSFIHPTAFKKHHVLRNLQAIQELCSTADTQDHLSPWLPKLNRNPKAQKVKRWGVIVRKSEQKQRLRLDCWLLNGQPVTAWLEIAPFHLQAGMLLDLERAKKQTRQNFRLTKPRLINPEPPETYPSVWQMDFQSTAEEKLELAIQQLVKKLDPSISPIISCVPLKFEDPYFKRQLSLLAKSDPAKNLDWQWLQDIQKVEMKLFSWPFDSLPIDLANIGLISTDQPVALKPK